MMSPSQQTAGRGWLPFEALRGATFAGVGPDLLAGLTLAAIAIPEQMATARLGGFPPQIGFYVFIVAAVGFAAFGASRQLSAGGDSTITPIFAGSLLLIATAGSPHFAALAAVLALMVGALVMLAGLFKLGWVADLLSTPVITGFLAGIAVHIVLSQAPALFGLADGSGDVYHRVAQLWAQAGGFNPASLGIGLGVFALIFGLERFNPRIPGALIALAAAALATASLGLAQHGVAVLGAVPAGVPRPALPLVAFSEVLKLASLAFVIALVVMVQTAATSRAFSPPGGDPDIDRDFVGVGAGSVLAGLFGGFPVNASPPRTEIVSQSGGRSQYAGLFAAVAVLLLAAFGTRLLAFVPTAALAGVLLFVAQRIFHLSVLAELLRRSRAEFALAVLTLVLIVLLPIQSGVAIGVIVSLAHGVFTITRAKPIFFERVKGTTVWWPAAPAAPPPTTAPVLVMGFQAPLSFLNAYDFRRGVLRAVAERKGAARLFVLEASSIVEIDFTAAKILTDVITAAREADMDFAVARLESVRAQAAFARFGIGGLIGDNHMFHSVDAAIQALAAPPPA